MFRPHPPIVIGLVGGVASGKSTVAGLLAEHGLVHLDADREARTVVAQPAVRTAIAARFGASVFDAAGALDRSALAALVFADRQALKDLEAITHPAVRAALLAGIERAHTAGQSVVLDVPLLVEGGLVERCDVCVFVAADDATRRARAAQRGWSPEQLAAREANQHDLDLKKQRCGYTLPATGSLDDTRQRVADLVARIARDVAGRI